MKAAINNVNIRGCEEKKNKKDEPYLLVRFEDASGKPEELVDKEIDRKKYYQRDTTGDLTINIDQGSKFTTIRIVDFAIHQ